MLGTAFPPKYSNKIAATEATMEGSQGRHTKTQQPIIVEEWSGSCPATLSITATITSSSPSSIHIERSFHRFKHVWTRVLGAFVPEGFPSSVTPDYACFQLWDSLQGLSTYIRTMLSTQALLSAIGVGEKSATVIGATFQWFLRDLTGMIGGIVFTLFQGSSLDSNAKMWRLAADVMNDLGMLMDLISPLFPSAFVFVVCLGSLSRSFTGVASGATRAALTQHFALQNNAADISAKEGSQEAIATMVGMAFGMILARITMGHSLCIWFSFMSLTMFHMYANYKAIRCLSLNSLNSERCSILLQHFMETRQAMYVLFVWKRVINIVIHKDSRAADVLRSFFHALVLENLLEGFTGMRTHNVLEGCNDRTMHEASQTWVDNHYHDFLAKLKSSGWNTEHLLSHSVVWKADWRCGSKFAKTD